MHFPDPNDRIMKLAEAEHFCPHCQQRLSFCHTPPFHVGDGLGWGTDVFFVCLNDECPLYAGSWERFEAQYGHAASCRYMLLPGEKKGEAMMVGGKDAFKGLVVDIDSIKKQNTRYSKEKEAVEQLACCIEQKNLEPVLYLLLDEAADIERRKEACERLASLNDLCCIDPLRNHKFRNTDLEQLVNIAISQILKANHRKECPFCAEVIKNQAKVCMHCKKEV